MAAKTDPKTDAKPDASLTGVKLTSMKVGNEMKPHARYAGPAPRRGSRISFTLDDGVTYSGKVLDVTDLDGDVLVEFDGPLEPQA